MSRPFRIHEAKKQQRPDGQAHRFMLCFNPPELAIEWSGNSNGQRGSLPTASNVAPQAAAIPHWGSGQRGRSERMDPTRHAVWECVESHRYSFAQVVVRH